MRALDFAPAALFAAALSGAVTADAQLPIRPPALHATPPATAADACPLTVFLDDAGTLYESRPGGRVTVSDTTLRKDLAAGCKDKGPVSSVRVQPSPHTKFGRVQQVLVLVRSVKPNVPITTVTPRSAR